MARPCGDENGFLIDGTGYMRNVEKNSALPNEMSTTPKPTTVQVMPRMTPAGVRQSPVSA